MAVKFRKKAVAALVAAALLMQGNAASALGLLQAYEAALQNDPTYQAARHENEAGQEYRAIGRSNLLPNLSASYSRTRNRADYTTPNILGKLTTTHPEYHSSSGAVQLRQPLFNMDAFARYQQGIAQTEYSDAIFSARGQELLVRLVSAYADAKYAEDQLALYTIQRQALAEQRAVNERMFQRGEGTKTDVLETQAKFDIAEAQLLEATDNLATARHTLSTIVGTDVTDLDSLRDDFRIMPLQPASFEEWKTIALERNAELAAQRAAVEAAHQEVNKGRAGHAPRVDFIAALSKGTSETLTTLNQDSTVRSVGVQVSIPLYSGGYTSAVTSQAAANHLKAKDELEAKTNQVMIELRKQYNLLGSSAARIEALVKSVRSARELVLATEQSVKGGVRINLDVLNARQQLTIAQRDLAQARYSYLLAYLRLRNAAGTLNAEDLNTVASYFNKGPSNATTAAAAATDMLAESKKLAVPVRVVAAAPEQPKSPPAAGAAQDEVLKTVSAWTEAWSAKDVEAYLGFYAGDFRPADKRSREAWAKERRAKITAKAKIAVRAEAPQVSIDGDTATVTFRQVYQSDRMSESSRKTLVLSRVNGQWKIRQERTA